MTVADDLRRGVVEPVQHQQQSGPYVPRGAGVAGRFLAGQVEEVVPFVLGQAQRTGERAQDLAGRPGAP